MFHQGLILCPALDWTAAAQYGPRRTVRVLGRGILSWLAACTKPRACRFCEMKMGAAANVGTTEDGGSRAELP